MPMLVVIPAMVSPIITVMAIPVVMSVTIIRDVHHGTAHDDSTGIWVDVNDAGPVGHHRRTIRLNLASMITGTRIVHRYANNRSCGCADHGTFDPAIIVVSTDQSTRHCPQHRRLANDRRPIDFSLRGTDSSHRERKSKE
jgi:hypothetical protein